MPAPGTPATAPLPRNVAPPPPRQRRAQPRGGLRVLIRGRPVTLRGLSRGPTGWLRWLALIGPGVLAANAGNDAGTIANYTAIGAHFGYGLLWLVLLFGISLAVVQETSARVGAATGRGLLDLVRERFGIGWALFAIVVILAANGAVVVTEFAGIAAAADLLDTSRFVAVPLAALAVAYLVILGDYHSAERWLLALTLAFVTYPVAAVLAHPSWSEVARGVIRPTLPTDPVSLLLVVGLIGATLTPYQQLFQQSAVVERGVPRAHYRVERLDVYLGALFSTLVAAFVVIASAVALHAGGSPGTIATAADAARALGPVFGAAAGTIFAIGLVGASLLAACVVPLATAYSVAEAFGFRKGVGLDPRRAPTFFRLFLALIVVGAAVALIPGLPLVPLLLAIQVLNGLLLPAVLVFLLLLANDARLMRELRNTAWQNVLGVGTLVAVAVAIGAVAWGQIVGLG